MRARFIALLAVTSMLWLPAAAPARASPVTPPDLPDLVEQTLPGVVNISSTTVVTYQMDGMQEFLRLWGMPQEHKQTSLGTGFLIDGDGFILTNNHVVEHATEVLVNLYDKRAFHARIIGKDQKMDLALLQIRDDKKGVPSGLKPVRLGNSDAVRIAESVFAVGNPFGLGHTVTLGIISAKNRTIGQGPFDNFLQTDASINPGNSGGPLFNLRGEVVGINTMIFSHTGQSGGVGFAIPINAAKALIPDLKRYGRVPRPWLGVIGQRLTPAIVDYYNLPIEDGALVTNLVQAGPGDAAGLQIGDIITNLNGQAVKEPLDIERALGGLKPTDSARLKFMRKARVREITIKLQELPRLENLPQGII